MPLKYMYAIKYLILVLQHVRGEVWISCWYQTISNNEALKMIYGAAVFCRRHYVQVIYLKYYE